MIVRPLVAAFLSACIAAPSYAAPEGAPAKPEAAAPAAEAPEQALPPERDPKAFYGFAITQPLIDREKIIPGGPGRGGGHPGDAANNASAQAAEAVPPATPGRGGALGADARADPTPILE
jgi:hypothetical protein